MRACGSMPRRAGSRSSYAELSRQVRLAGLLDRRSGYYTMRISATVAAYAAVWVAVVLVGESWWVLALAPAMAIAHTQLAFVGHDAGHRQILRGRRANDLLGITVANLGVGLSYGWWIDKHNRHHAHPNQEGRDPDIAPGALVFVPSQTRARNGISRAWIRLQAFIFFPLLLLEGLNLFVASVRALTGRTAAAPRHRGLEIPAFVLNVGGYLAVLFLTLTPGQAVTFIRSAEG